ncbi:MAG: sulfite exporter TauE/SafE family protein [Ginsengibacter sp.]
MRSIIAGWSMIRENSYTPSTEKQSFTRLIIQGCINGAITGFIGIGGGFIIVPSLVLFAGHTMNNAIGTSLTIITVNCLVGILGNLEAVASLDYLFLSTFAAFAIIGVLAGTWAVRFIPDRKLRPVFGWLVLAMSVIVFIRIFTGY